MATSTRQQSGGSPPTHSPGGSRPVYEGFRPNSEWKKEEEQQQSHEVLLVYLPGFFKEQLRVSTEGTDILRICGECLVGGNKWRRFQEDFRIPEDCNIRGIRAKFEGETLTITMPKKTKISTRIAQLVGLKEESETTQLGGGPPRPRPPLQDTKDKQPRYYEKVHHQEQEDIQHQKAQLTSDDAKRVDDDGAADNKSSSSGVQFPSPRETSSPKYQKGKTTTTTTATGGGGQDHDTTTPPKITSTVISDGKQTDDRQKVLQESKLPPQKAKEAAAATEPKSQKKKGRQDETPMSSTGGVVDKQQPDGKEVGSTTTSAAAKIVQQAETTERKERSELLMPTEKDYTERKAKRTTDVRSGGGFEVEKYKQKQQQAVKRGLAANKGHLIMNKERQMLMVNMGVAVLVIVALGAYVSYTLGVSSSGKPKN